MYAHPMTFLCRQRGEVEVQLQPMRNLGARRGWVVVKVLDTD
jgi:hypothetical protein